METNLLLDTYLRELRLPAFLQNYRKFAEEAAQANQSYDRFLLALAEQEATQRDRNRITRCRKSWLTLTFPAPPAPASNGWWSWHAGATSRKPSQFSWSGILVWGKPTLR